MLSRGATTIRRTAHALQPSVVCWHSQEASKLSRVNGRVPQNGYPTVLWLAARFRAVTRMLNDGALSVRAALCALIRARGVPLTAFLYLSLKNIACRPGQCQSAICSFTTSARALMNRDEVLSDWVRAKVIWWASACSRAPISIS
jgi:hypothetical protein